jgi:hypothetical protein
MIPQFSLKFSEPHRKWFTVSAGLFCLNSSDRHNKIKFKKKHENFSPESSLIIFFELLLFYVLIKYFFKMSLNFDHNSILFLVRKFHTMIKL